MISKRLRIKDIPHNLTKRVDVDPMARVPLVGWCEYLFVVASSSTADALKVCRHLKRICRSHNGSHVLPTHLRINGARKTLRYFVRFMELVNIPPPHGQLSALVALIADATKTVETHFARSSKPYVPSLDDIEPHPLDIISNSMELRLAIQTIEGACAQLMATVARPSHTVFNVSTPASANVNVESL